jgi:hypothetical protein
MCEMGIAGAGAIDLVAARAVNIHRIAADIQNYDVGFGHRRRQHRAITGIHDSDDAIEHAWTQHGYGLRATDARDKAITCRSPKQSPTP